MNNSVHQPIPMPVIDGSVSSPMAVALYQSSSCGVNLGVRIDAGEHAEREHEAVLAAGGDRRHRGAGTVAADEKAGAEQQTADQLCSQVGRLDVELG